MKVLHINAVLDIGSTGRIMRDIHEASLKEGFDSVIAYSVCSSSSNLKNTYRIGNYLDHKVHAFLSRISDNQASFSHIATYKFIRFIKSYKPNVVHIHNIHANFIDIYKLMDFLAVNNIAVVITLHDCWFFTGGCTHYTYYKCGKWQEECKGCPQYKTQYRPALFDGAKRNRSNKFAKLSKLKKLFFVGVSNWVARESKKFGLGNAQYATIYNGVDFTIFHPVESNLRKHLSLENQFVLLGPSDKWLLEENRDSLIKIASNLGENYTIILFGGTKAQYELPQNIIQYGYTSSPSELAKLYSMSDVFINSTRQDTLSLINVEAQACGTPVITFNNTGAKETVDGKCGFVVENDDIDEMINNIRIIQSNTKSYYSADCVRWARMMFDKEVNYAQYINLYKSLV